MLEQFDSFYSVCICNDNSMFLNEIIQQSKQKQKVVIMIMTRIGLQQPQQGYLNAVFKLMKNQYFFTILGGTPKRAHLFLYHDEKNKKLGYLDPHKTNKSIQNLKQLPQHLHEYHSKLQWIKQNKIDSSMCISFVMQKNQIQIFWNQMIKLKEQLKDDFFIYMDQEKPVFDQNDFGIIQIKSDDEECEEQNQQKQKQ